VKDAIQAGTPKTDIPALVRATRLPLRAIKDALRRLT
jgi:hypothetical protein